MSKTNKPNSDEHDKQPSMPEEGAPKEPTDVNRGMSRRSFLRWGAGAGAGLVFGGLAADNANAEDDAVQRALNQVREKQKKEPENPGEEAKEEEVTVNDMLDQANETRQEANKTFNQNNPSALEEYGIGTLGSMLTSWDLWRDTTVPLLLGLAKEGLFMRSMTNRQIAMVDTEAGEHLAAKRTVGADTIDADGVKEWITDVTNKAEEALSFSQSTSTGVTDLLTTLNALYSILGRMPGHLKNSRYGNVVSNLAVNIPIIIWMVKKNWKQYGLSDEDPMKKRNAARVKKVNERAKTQGASINNAGAGEIPDGATAWTSGGKMLYTEDDEPFQLTEVYPDHFAGTERSMVAFDDNTHELLVYDGRGRWKPYKTTRGKKLYDKDPAEQAKLHEVELPEGTTRWENTQAKMVYLPDGNQHVPAAIRPTSLYPDKKYVTASVDGTGEIIFSEGKDWQYATNAAGDRLTLIQASADEPEDAEEPESEVALPEGAVDWTEPMMLYNAAGEPLSDTPRDPSKLLESGHRLAYYEESGLVIVYLEDENDWLKLIGPNNEPEVYIKAPEQPESEDEDVEIEIPAGMTEWTDGAKELYTAESADPVGTVESPEALVGPKAVVCVVDDTGKLMFSEGDGWGHVRDTFGNELFDRSQVAPETPEEEVVEEEEEVFGEGLDESEPEEVEEDIGEELEESESEPEAVVIEGVVVEEEASSNRPAPGEGDEDIIDVEFTPKSVQRNLEQSPEAEVADELPGIGYDSESTPKRITHEPSNVEVEEAESTPKRITYEPSNENQTEEDSEEEQIPEGHGTFLVNEEGTVVGRANADSEEETDLHEESDEEEEEGEK